MANMVLIENLVSILVFFLFFVLPIVVSIIIAIILIFYRYRELKEENFERRRS